jgi:putative flippase GtrA
MMAFVRFAMVGGSFSLSYALITAGLIRFAAAPPLLTSVVVYLLCIPAAFWAQRHIAFRADQQAKGAIWIYAATQIGSLAVVSAITTRFVTRVFWQDTLLFLVTAGTAAVASFLICRYIIFRPSGSAAR